jgi:HNH endonuclease
MAITDKTRKILWGRSGNRCAICKRELVLDATNVNDESIVGDECHIRSGQTQGPRHDPNLPMGRVDSYDNLILLCRVHHKMVDDQCDTYTADIMSHMKANHEKWVSEKLSDSERAKPFRLRRIKHNIPAYLTRLTTGKEVLKVVDGAYAFLFDHDELHNEAEVELVGSFLQNAQDWGDLVDELEYSDRVRIGFQLTRSLRELEDAGFFVFGGREVRIAEGGIGGPSKWPVAILHVIRKTDKSIIMVNLHDLKAKNVQDSDQGSAG